MGQPGRERWPVVEGVLGLPLGQLHLLLERLDLRLRQFGGDGLGRHRRKVQGHPVLQDFLLLAGEVEASRKLRHHSRDKARRGWIRHFVGFAGLKC